MKVYTSAVVIIPPKENWAPIQAIRKLYDRQINRWMPHITMLYPFRPESEFSNLEKIFLEKCKNIKPFEIALRNFNFFSHVREKYTIWLDPEPNESIISIQADLLKLVPNCDDVIKFKSGYKPHLSIGQIKGKIKLEKIINRLQKNWIEVKFLINKIYFISREQDKISKFEIRKSISFENKIK